MDSKLLTERGWKTVLQETHIRDNGLQRALSDYEKLDEDKLQERVEALESISRLAKTLMRVREVAALAKAADYLDDVAKAAEETKKRIAPMAGRDQARTAQVTAWANRVRAASGQKPDLPKLKNLLTQMQGIMRNTPLRRTAAVPGAGKAGEGEDPCHDQFLDVVEKFGGVSTLIVGVLAAEYVAILAIEEIIEAAGATLTVAGLQAFLTGGGAMLQYEDHLEKLTELWDKLQEYLEAWDDYNEAFDSWQACVRQRDRDEALRETDAEVQRMNQQMRERHAQIQREAQRVRQYVNALPPAPRTH